MKKLLFSSLSLLLALTMLLGVLAGCDGGQDETDTKEPSQTTEETTEKVGSETEKVTETGTEKPGDSETETETEPGNVDVKAEGEHADIINLNNTYANGVQAYFTDGSRTHYNLQNTEMTMSYARSKESDQLVASITNTKGQAYIENTMDIFVRMTNGSTYYASQSNYSAEANLYRFGYYYYQGIFEFQNFIPKNFNSDIVESINVQKPNTSQNHQVRVSKNDDGITYTITNNKDPYFVYSGLNISTDIVNSLVLTAKATGNISSLQLFYTTTGGSGSFTQTQSITFPVTIDGEFHTYSVSFDGLKGFEGDITAIRLDPNGGNVGDQIEITDISFGKAQLDNLPADLQINRHFHVYSDKMHHAVQFATLVETTDIAEIGMITAIPVDKVAKLLIIGENDKQYTSLDGFDWADVQAVAFDIKDTGIFGFILPISEEAGTIKVTVEDGNYVIEQTRVPDGNKIIPSASDVLDKNGNLQNVSGIKNNGNDVYLAQRVYTDENHDFDEFVYETYCERNPIKKGMVRIGEDSDMSSFEGYDPIRGIYIFNIATPGGGFYTPYKEPNKNYKINFAIVSEKNIDRDIYIMTSGTAGLLECAALLDKDLMMLPIPIEVIKNFSETSGERNLFNISDPTFSEAIFMLSLKAGERYEYNILNLYQNWGNYPLKQLSQIPFHCPYYHLSTGVTETNCILPWFGTAYVGKGSRLNTLPDFRSMSAPFWSGQPQHNSSGSHSWLEYTDADSRFCTVESTSNIITSFGPTYAEVVMNNISDDGKIAVTYTHMEMPQLDENRTYYTMEYTVLEDLTINDFKHKFQFYGVTDNNATGVYERLGYLNENNESVVVAANTDSKDEFLYILGDECPYFSFFDMPEWNRESKSAEGYANVAFLIYNSKFIIGGEEVTPQFAIVNSKDHVRVTLNLDTVEFKAGDKFTINAILMPWGSQELDGTYDEVQDEQVREVRRNTLLNPLTATSETDTVMESPYLPKVRSNDGKTAQFTLSGGENNVTVKIYGFEKLTSPKVEELVDGEWVEYVLSSKNSPDRRGNYHYYDGYCVQFEDDGTYSYSFVTTMTDGAPRTFRISADEDFTPWPKEVAPEGNEDFLNVYIDSEELDDACVAYKACFGDVSANEEDGIKYITFAGSNDRSESYLLAYTTSTKVESGQYFVVKYRIPSTNTTSVNFEFFTSTQNNNAVAGDNFKIQPIADGEWHVAIVDISKSSAKTFTADEDGKYYTKYLRFDVFNTNTPISDKVDVAYVGIDSSLEKICQLESANFETVDYYVGDSVFEFDTNTLQPCVKTYLDPSSGYTQSDVAFASQLDYVSTNTSVVSIQATIKNGISIVVGFNAADNKTFAIRGWCVANGGISRYVWSVDGGKTWNNFSNDPKSASDEMIKVGQGRIGITFEDGEASKLNGSFQGKGGIFADLSAYAGQKVDLIIGAIPASDSEAKSLILLYCFEKVNVPE